jgi:hypothetical protein
MGDPASNEPLSRGLLHRVALRGIVFVLELIALTALARRRKFVWPWRGLTGFMGYRGSRILQSAAVFASLGLTFSYFRIGDAVVAHTTTNALLAAWVLMGGKWYLSTLFQKYGQVSSQHSQASTRVSAPRLYETVY